MQFENFDEQEKNLLEQLNIIRQKKEQQKKEQQKEIRKNEILGLIKENDEQIYNLEHQVLKLKLKNSLLQDELGNLNIEEIPIIEQPVIEQPELIIEQVQELTLDYARQLTHTQLDKLTLCYNQVEINMCDAQIGDIIRIYPGRGFGVQYVKVTRKTHHNLFYKNLITNDLNLVLKYDWMINGYCERTYNYWLIDINNMNNVEGAESKIAIKNKTVDKAIRNFIKTYEFDWGA